MPSVPTTSLDLGATAVVVDPYPHFAAERAQHEVAWHETSGSWLTFSHAATSAVLRDRALGRIWRDGEPTDHLEPFNLVAFGAGLHFCLGASLARMELGESLTALFARFPGLGIAGEPESRGTFVLRGFRRVPVTGRAGAGRDRREGHDSA